MFRQAPVRPAPRCPSRRFEPVAMLRRRPLRSVPPHRERSRSSPSRITAMRSHMPSSSGRSDDAIRTAMPLARHVADDGVDIELGADVDAARRLVEQQDSPASPRERLGEDHLLLVAAAEFRSRAGSDRRLQAHIGADAHRQIAPLSARGVRKAPPRLSGCRWASVMFSKIGRDSNEPFGPALARDVGEALLPCAATTVGPVDAAHRAGCGPHWPCRSPNSVRSRSRWPEPASPAMPRISPLRSVKADPIAAAQLERSRTASATSCATGASAARDTPPRPAGRSSAQRGRRA